MLAHSSLPTWLTKQLNCEQSDLPLPVQKLKHDCTKQLLQYGLPNSKHEAWKYTDLSFLKNNEFIAGEETTNLPIKLVSNAQQDVIVCSLKEALATHSDLCLPYLQQELNTQDYPFAAINLALFQNGLFIYVPKNCEVNIPIHLQFTQQVAHRYCIIVLEENSKLVLFEEYHANSVGEDNNSWTNIVHNIHLKSHARLQYYKLQNESANAFHTTAMFIQQESHSEFSSVNIACGAQFARDDVQVNLSGVGAACHATGFYSLDSCDQYIDNHVTINHKAPHTKSTMLYKGILARKSIAVFNGRLHVEKSAEKIVANQENHHILLDEAHAYSKPELEIYADDVQCKHGATTGQLDEDALFYLRARGLDKEQAIKILIESFAAEVITKICHSELQNYIRQRCSHAG